MKSRVFLLAKLVLAGLLVALGSGCAQYSSSRGLEVNWAPASLSGLVRGQTTRSDILARLGPPSQLIAAGDETVLYYLNEQSQGRGVVTFVYNRFDVVTRYDRAVFFFDAEDRLTDYSAWVRTPAEGQ